MSRIRHFTESFALLACLTLLLAVTGCSGDSVVAPIYGSGSGTSESTPLDISTPKGDPNPHAAQGYGQLISATNGGSITNGRVTLEFPAGALDQDTYITMRMVGPSNLQVEFGPHGLVFNKDVLMRMNLEGTSAEGDAENTPIKWWNPVTAQWEDITSLPPEHSNESKGLLEHFSRYAGVNG